MFMYQRMSWFRKARLDIELLKIFMLLLRTLSEDFVIQDEESQRFWIKCFFVWCIYVLVNVVLSMLGWRHEVETTILYSDPNISYRRKKMPYQTNRLYAYEACNTCV